MAEDEPKSELVSLEVPGRVLRDLRSLVDAGLYLSLDEALREALLNSWRYLRASCHRIRIDPDEPVADDEGKARDDA